jgi:hypothetical protein
LPTVGHGGADAGYRSDITRFPDQHFSVTVLCNAAEANPGGLLNQVADIFLAKDFKAPESVAAKEQAKTDAPPLTAKQMAAIAGTYWKQDDDDFQKILVKDGKLQIDLGGDDFHALTPFEAGHFHIADVPWGNDIDLHFVAAETGKPHRLEQIFSGGKPDVYEAVTPFDPTPAELTGYAGAYVSEEIDPVYRIAFNDGKLTLMRLKHKPDTLRPTMRDYFVGDVGTIHFTRDASQHVSGFILDAGRIQNFRFTKRVN